MKQKCWYQIHTRFYQNNAKLNKLAYFLYIFNKKTYLKNLFKKFPVTLANKKSALILLWKKINKNRSQNIIKASAFYKIQNFFLVLFKQTFFWYMSKMYLQVLTLVTLFEPTLVGQLSHSFLITYILEVASNSIALWKRQIIVLRFTKDN